MFCFDVFSIYIQRVVTDCKRLRTEKVIVLKGKYKIKTAQNIKSICLGRGGGERNGEKAKKAALSKKFENEPLISPKLM